MTDGSLLYRQLTLTSSTRTSSRSNPPIVMGLLPKYGGEVLASDTAGTLDGGDGTHDECDYPFPVEGGRARALQR